MTGAEPGPLQWSAAAVVALAIHGLALSGSLPDLPGFTTPSGAAPPPAPFLPAAELQPTEARMVAPSLPAAAATAIAAVSAAPTIAPAFAANLSVASPPLSAAGPRPAIQSASGAAITAGTIEATPPVAPVAAMSFDVQAAGPAAPSAPPITEIVTARPVVASGVPASSASPPTTAAMAARPSQEIEVRPAQTVSRADPVAVGVDIASVDVTAAEPVGTDRERAIAAVAGILDDEDCTTVRRVADGDDGPLRYAGFVPSEADRARLAAEIAENAQGVDVQLDLAVAGRPFCTAFVALPGAVEGRDVMILNRDDGIYLDGDLLQVDIGPVPADGYLQVTFIDHTGEVLQMLPSRFAENVAIAAGEVRELGVEEGVLEVLRQLGVNIGSWKVEGPFGRGLILALLTRQPLAFEAAPQGEDAGSYFEGLRAALIETPAIWARYRWIDTRPRS